MTDVETLRVGVPDGVVAMLVLGPVTLYFLTDPIDGKVNPTQVYFEHDCRMIDEHHRVRCAPALDPAHRVDIRPDGVHVNPSILCPDCGTHGFVTATQWEPV